MSSTSPPWDPRHTRSVGPIPPVWRAYYLLPQPERDLIRHGVEHAGMAPSLHAYLTHAILYSLQARDDRKRRVRPARIPATIARDDHARDIASRRVRDTVAAVRNHRERVKAEQREQRAADHQWDPAA